MVALRHAQGERASVTRTYTTGLDRVVGELSGGDGLAERFQIKETQSVHMTGASLESATQAPLAKSRQAMSALPVVAIVGRPNVGKSTLFNRLTGRRIAIVSEVPGTTRDRLVAQVSWGDKAFLLVDTGGLQPEPESDMWAKVRAQVDVAVHEAQVIVFLVDVMDGVTPGDLEVADLLRRTQKPVVLAVNKVDSPRREPGAMEFYQMGLGDPVVVSAYHNSGVEELVARVVELLPPGEVVAGEGGVLRLAILGRTNVGKSSFLNTALGEERAIVSEVPGTTRDALDTPVEYKGRSMVLIDTAGIRRRGRIEQGIERYSVLRAEQALARCDVAILLVEALEPMMAQDLHIAGSILDAYRGMVVVVNKWDLAKSEEVGQEEVLDIVHERLRFASYVPVCFASALQGEGIEEALDTAVGVYQERLKTVPQGQLQRMLLEAVGRHPPPSSGKRSLNIYRVEQVGVNPPAFAFFVNHPELVHFSYQRFLENTLRKTFGFRGSRLQLTFRRRGEKA